MLASVGEAVGGSNLGLRSSEFFGASRSGCAGSELGCTLPPPWRSWFLWMAACDEAVDGSGADGASELGASGVSG